jgi:hypothetical protein
LNTAVSGYKGWEFGCGDEDGAVCNTSRIAFWSAVVDASLWETVVSLCDDQTRRTDLVFAALSVQHCK